MPSVVAGNKTSVKKGSLKKNGKKNFAPFGVAVPRFATIGFHPGLDPTGSLRKKGGIGPGHYPLKFIDCPFKRCKASREPWTRKGETEEFSQNLGYRMPHVLREREEWKKANGPGTLEVSEDLFKQQSNNVKKNVYFGTTDRFKKSKRIFVNPPPGTYGKNHDPHLRRKEASRPIHQWTPLPSFEWDSFINRFKIGRYEPKSLPPNIYANKRQSGIYELLNKRVSKRGPYDLFTGPRDERTIKGYFSPSHLDVKSWPIKLPGEFERLKKRKNYGRFLQCDRFTKNPGTRLMLTDLVMCPKNPNDPGPGHYDVEKRYDFKQNIAAFNQSVLYVRPVKKWEIHPGVGRYDAKPPRCKCKEKRESFMFKSASKREFYTITTYNNF